MSVSGPITNDGKLNESRSDSSTTFWDKEGRSGIGGKFVNKRVIDGSLTFPSYLPFFRDGPGSALRTSVVYWVAGVACWAGSGAVVCDY